MTSETRTLIEAADITGVEIECPKCHLAMLYPVVVEHVITIGHNCPHCNLPFFDEANNRAAFGGNNYPAIENIQQIAAHLRALIRPDRTDIQAQIRFRVNTESKAKP
jgi:hypothetical protein